HSKRTDRYGFTREFKVYECDDCSGCPLRDLCTKARKGNNRRVYINEKWESQKEYVRTKLSDEKAGELYGKRKIDVEPAIGFLKVNLRFSRFSVTGKDNVTNESGFALMAVNLRKYTAMNDKIMLGDKNNPEQRFQAHFLLLGTFLFTILASYVPASFLLILQLNYSTIVTFTVFTPQLLASAFIGT